MKGVEYILGVSQFLGIKMKKKLSITIGEEKIKELEKLLEGSRFRNKSHVIEYSLEKFLRGRE